MIRAERALARARAFEILEEAERARAADLFEERLRREVHRHGLAKLAQRRMLEIDLDVDAEAVVRIEPHPLVAFLDLDALQHADEALRRALLLDAGRLQQEHERRGAAVHDRHLGRRQIDERVVDTQARHGRHQMLDRADLAPSRARASCRASFRSRARHRPARRRAPADRGAGKRCRYWPAPGARSCRPSRPSAGRYRRRESIP